MVAEAMLIPKRYWLILTIDFFISNFILISGNHYNVPLSSKDQRVENLKFTRRNTFQNDHLLQKSAELSRLQRWPRSWFSLNQYYADGKHLRTGYPHIKTLPDELHLQSLLQEGKFHKPFKPLVRSPGPYYNLQQSLITPRDHQQSSCGCSLDMAKWPHEIKKLCYWTAKTRTPSTKTKTPWTTFSWVPSTKTGTSWTTFSWVPSTRTNAPWTITPWVSTHNPWSWLPFGSRPWTQITTVKPPPWTFEPVIPHTKEPKPWTFKPHSPVTEKPRPWTHKTWTYKPFTINPHPPSTEKQRTWSYKPWTYEPWTINPHPPVTKGARKWTVKPWSPWTLKPWPPWTLKQRPTCTTVKPSYTFF